MPKQLYGCLYFLLLTVSAPSPAAERELEDLPAFDAVTASGGIDVRIVQGDTPSVIIKTMLASTDDILAEVTAGKLNLSRKSSTFMFFLQWLANYRVYIVVPELTSLQASDGSDVRGEGVFSGEQLRLVASSKSELSIEVDVASLTVESSGGSELELRGSADTFTATASDGAEIDASRLQTGRAVVEASGESSIEVAADERLQASATSGSRIRYGGEPTLTEIETSGDAEASAR